ncbi:MAG: DUF1295 domain-containing protein [Ignavibacteriae bacterium]|nr:DUF1295 domain-containing protein [Ignavibacteriota bacterium]
MATLTFIYESLFSNEYKTTLKESVVVAFLLAFYNFSSYYSNFLVDDTVTTITMLGGLYIGYAWIKTFFTKEEIHLKFYIIYEVISRSFSKYLSSNKQLETQKLLTNVETNNLLFVFVKMFYIPVMLNFTFSNYGAVSDLFFRLQFYKISDFTIIHWYKLLLPIFFLVDTSYYLFGYLIESKKLGSTVRSVDKSTLSWLVTLACYPPFNGISTTIFTWYADDSNLMFPSMLNYILLAFVIVLFGIYLSATISLGSKCSNLTNRGTVNRGMYKYIRHPAYSAKVLAWWLMTIPIMNGFVFLSMLMWSVIYLVRALKEEDHLLQDKEYHEYFMNTPNRFIPKVF